MTTHDLTNQHQIDTKPDLMVSKLHQDLDSFERIVPLVGFVGPSQHSERIRLYPRLDFDAYYEIHVADILHRSRNDSGDDGPSTLYVKASGRIEIISSITAKDVASPESSGLESPLNTITPDPGTFSSTEPTLHSNYPHNPTGDAVRDFANSRLGMEVGGGECTDLVSAALQAANAQPGSNFSNPPYYVWGTEITQPPYTDWGTWQNGDIIQFAYAHFQWVYGGQTHQWGVGSTGRHTAIIWNGMFSHTGPWETWLIHQNDGVRVVTQRMLWMRHLVSGSFKVYRPIPL